MKTLFPCVPIQYFFSKYFLFSIYLPQSTMYLPSQKLASHTWKQFETTPKKERRHHHQVIKSSSHQVIKSSSPRQPFFPGGLDPHHSFQGQLVTPTPILGWWVVSQSPPGKHRQVYLIGAADRASNLPTECGVVYLRTWTDGWDKRHGINVMFRCHDFWLPGEETAKRKQPFFFNEWVYNHDSLALRIDVATRGPM